MADPELVERLLSSGFLSPGELSREPVWELGRYVVLHGLGQGASSEVLLARDPLLGRQVAIKLLKAVADPTRFAQEMKLLAALEHPHVVKVYDGGLHEGRPYFVMEYLGAHTLESAELDLDRTVALLEQVARACHHAHGQGVVHRDLKPANILVAEDGRAVVADFGIAKLLDRPGHTVSGMIVGTLAYMAPEQLAGGDRIGPAVDVYALGAMLYERLCGRLPREASDVETFLTKLASSEPVRPPSELAAEVPPELEAVVLRAIAYEPEARFASAAELADALAGWRVSGASAPASPASPDVAAPTPHQPPSELLRLVAVIALPLALAVIGVAFVFKAQKRPAQLGSTPAPSSVAPSSPASPVRSALRAPARPVPAPSPGPTETPSPEASAEVARAVQLLQTLGERPEAERPTVLRTAAIAIARGIVLGDQNPEAHLLLARCCRLLGPLAMFDALHADGMRALARALTNVLPRLRVETPSQRDAHAAVHSLRDFCAGQPSSAEVAATALELTQAHPRQASYWLTRAMHHLLALKRALPRWAEAEWVGFERCRAEVERLDPQAPELDALRKTKQGLAALRAKLRGGQ